MQQGRSFCLRLTRSTPNPPFGLSGLLNEGSDGGGGVDQPPASTPCAARRQITLAVRWNAAGDRIEAIAWEGSGCSISQSSASLLATLAEESTDEGSPWTPDELTALIEEFREALRSRGAIPLDEERFGDAAALSGVSKYVAPRQVRDCSPWVAAVRPALPPRWQALPRREEGHAALETTRESWRSVFVW